MKYRTRFDRNKTRVIRVSVAAYLVLKQAADENGITIAEIVDLLLNKRETTIRVEPKILRAQIPLPTTRIVMAKPVIAVNGARSSAIAVKPKGGVLQ